MTNYVLEGEEVSELYKFLLNLEEDIPEWFEKAFMPFEKFESLIEGETFPEAENFENVKNIMKRDFYEMCEDKNMQARLLRQHSELEAKAKRERAYLEMPDEECLFTTEQYRKLYAICINFFDGDVPEWFLDNYMPFEEFLAKLKPIVEEDGIADFEKVKNDTLAELTMIQDQFDAMRALEEMFSEMPEIDDDDTFDDLPFE